MNAPRPETPRWMGFELMRGIGAFGVIGLHAGLVVHNRTTPAAGAMRELFLFAVPFFLLTALYFEVQAEARARKSWREWLAAHGARLGVPFVVWSLIYFGLRWGLFQMEHREAEAAAFASDPLGLLLSGGGSMALYFLPLLFVGLIMCRLARPWLVQAPSWVLLALLVMLTACADYLGRHGVGPGPAGLVVRAAPFVVAAVLGQRFLPAPSRAKAWPVLLAGLVVLAVAIADGVRGVLPEIVPGLGAWLVAWGWSGLIAPSRIVAVLGAYTFGIYLAHQVVLEAMQRMADHIASGTEFVGAGAMLGVTVTAFALSFGLVSVASRGGPIVRRIFGLR